MSEAAHKTAREALSGIELDASNLADIYTQVKGELIPFSQVTHEELDDLGIEAQIEMVLNGTRKPIGGYSKPDDFVMPFICIILNERGDTCLDSFLTPEKCDDLRRTALTAVSVIKGTHRGRCYLGPLWPLVVANDLGVARLPAGHLAQKGFSQGWQLNVSVERAPRDLKDMRELRSSLDWVVSVEMLSFPVVCGGNTRCTLSKALELRANLCKNLNFNLNQLEVSAVTNENLRYNRYSETSENHASVNLMEWTQYASQRPLVFERSAKRPRTPQPDEDISSTQM